MENNFKVIILELKKLKQVKARKGFRDELYKQFSPVVERPFFFYRCAFILAAIVLVSFCVGRSVAVASFRSSPGDVLYPLKEVLKSTFKVDTNPSTPAPSITPTSVPSPSPSAKTINEKNIIVPTPTLTPTAQPITLEIPQIVDNAIITDLELEIPDLPIDLNILGTPTPSASQILDLDVIINVKPILKIGF